MSWKLNYSGSVKERLYLNERAAINLRSYTTFGQVCNRLSALQACCPRDRCQNETQTRCSAATKQYRQ